MKRAKRLILKMLQRTLGHGSKLEVLLRRVYRRAAQRSREGRESRTERMLKTWYVTLKGGRGRSFSNKETFTLMWSDSLRSAKRVGIYAKGSCDLPAVFGAAPRMRKLVNGTCAVFLERGGVSAARSDILLQTLRPQAPEVTSRLKQELALYAGYFEPTLFEESFRIPGYEYLGEFPKSVVFLSIAADVVRTIYRHGDSGLLIDPGGWWLNQDMSKVLSNLDKVAWFQDNFEKVGKMGVEDFYANFSEVIRTLQARTKAEILVLNTLEVEPGDPTHTYQLVANPGTKRRREFNLALIEMARELDFGIVDVDRILKREGVQSQVDFSHFPKEGFRPLADEISRILEDMDIFM